MFLSQQLNSMTCIPRLGAVFLVFVCPCLFGPLPCCHSHELIQLLHRHGDRVPVDGGVPRYPVDWQLRLGVGLGQLTGLGATQALQLGEWLRQRYVDQFGLLARNYNSSEVLVQSSQYDRAMQTANLVLSGLFSNGSEGLRVPVFTTPRANDVLLRGYDICGGGRKRVMEQLVQSDVWTTKQQLSQEFFSWFMNVTGFTSINFVEFTSLYFDPVFVMYAHALLPAEIAIRIDEIIELADWVKWNKIHALGSLTAGTLLQQIVSNVDTAMNSSIASPKFIQYSAHDYTMMSLAATMELDSNPLFQKIPDYASAMVLELWAAEAKSSVNNNNDNTRLVMYYRDGVSGNVTGAVMNVSVAELHALNIRRGFQMQGWCDACANWTSVSVMPEPCLRISRSISTPTPTPTPTTTDATTTTFLTVAIVFGTWSAVCSVLLLFIMVKKFRMHKQESTKQRMSRALIADTMVSQSPGAGVPVSREKI